MTVEQIVTSSMGWLWEKFGPKVIARATAASKKKWEEFQWESAEAKYRERLLEQINTIRLLGHPKPIQIDAIYTDVHVLDERSAFRRFDFSQASERGIGELERLSSGQHRTVAEDLVADHKRLYILGKPGAGKTTFLKHLALQACKGKIEKTPIYIPLKEWSDSGKTLDSFITESFDICGFPNAAEFVSQILESGTALVLFDGLDEVNQEGPSRQKMIGALEQLSNKHSESTFCITCRIAASDYNFARFQYIEVADFDKDQKLQFIERWYSDAPDSKSKFIDEWNKSDSSGFRELAATPLLLTLICLTFDETLCFPRRRVELYQEATDALLKKWDSSRGVFRSDLYRRLSLDRKKQLLARLAASNFDAGKYLLEKNRLLTGINEYLTSLPRDEAGARADAEDVLLAIEAQHGLLVERAHKIYSFSHLTLQEYFTARHLIDNQSQESFAKLIRSAHEHSRWREVFLMTASMLDDASMFLKSSVEIAYNNLSQYPRVTTLIDRLTNPEVRFSTDLLIESVGANNCDEQSEQLLDAIFALAGELAVGHCGTPSKALTRSRSLSKLFAEATAKKPHTPQEKLAKSILASKSDATAFTQYLHFCCLSVEALRVSIAADRETIENFVLSPI